jgi:16S rRNA (uracil1498-N3)-methyltransferase
LSVVERRELPPSACEITLAQAIPKGKLIETIIQKATELGAARIVPLLTERVAIRLSDADAAVKQVKWQQVAIEAVKQCGAARLPRVDAPVSIAQLLARKEAFEFTLIASLHEGGRHPREFLRDFASRQGRLPRSVCVWVGPEGDFTPEEAASVRDAGACPISLGPLVLRTDTAASYCLSFLGYELSAPTTTN